jgi:hypothetical protein
MYIPKQRARSNSFNAVTSRFLAGVLPLLGAQNRAQFHHLAFAPARFTVCYIFLRTTRPKIHRYRISETTPPKSKILEAYSTRFVILYLFLEILQA